MRRDLLELPDLLDTEKDAEDLTKTRCNNLLQIVVTKKRTERSPLQASLIELTEKLAEEAKSGVLKGIGGFALYEDGGYIFGLEGSYLPHPESAIVPLKRLEKRIMDQIEDEGK